MALCATLLVVFTRRLCRCLRRFGAVVVAHSELAGPDPERTAPTHLPHRCRRRRRRHRKLAHTLPCSAPFPYISRRTLRFPPSAISPTLPLAIAPVARCLPVTVDDVHAFAVVVEIFGAGSTLSLPGASVGAQAVVVVGRGETN
ncbi:hypothetical protein DFP72DRAFT_80827 [Ephemerocybe angulata]|uniref:Secreted protein n=1 Tax=Ephemerocybe angulata TaxID=980116 RepID=A0A8H6HCA8_9AGAR|nr:hypothetical protein DFP72DRAFT_80827 [Tulosesus angulatus]